MEGNKVPVKRVQVRSRGRSRLRSRKLLAAVISIVILAGLAGGGAVGYVQLKGRADRLQAALIADLQAGQQELQAGKTSLTQANNKHDASLIAEAITHFGAARTHFLAASQTADSSRLIHDLELVPAAGGFVHSRHTAVDGISAMGVALADAGKGLSDLDGQLIKPAVAGQAGRTLLTVLDQAQPTLTAVRDDLTRAQDAAATVDIQVVPGSQQATFIKARDTIAKGLIGLDEFQRLVPVLKEVLGGNGARTYLIEQVDPAELRAGGGFLGTYSLVGADHGALSVIKSGNAYDLVDPRPLPGQPGFIDQVGPYREVIPYISWSLVDSNIYPDFPSNAKVAETFVEPQIGSKIDGVISIDYYSVAKMLELTGPITVPGYDVSVDANNFIPTIVAAAVIGDPAHKAILSALAGPLMERVSALPADRWPALITAFNALATSRHLQAYFNSDAAEKEITRVGWSGTVDPARAADFMMEVESNYYGDKVNYFLTRQYGVVLTRQGVKLHHKVTVSFVNATQAGSEDRTVYKADVRLYVHDTASTGSNNLRAVQYPNPDPPSGYRMFDGWVSPDVACCGGQGQAVFEYDTPWLARDAGGHEIYWQKEPGTLVDKVEVTWNDGEGHTYHASADLGQDRVITLSSNAVTLAAGQPAQATLPTLSLG